ncbi:peptidase associated/transthyretin-like domain-containing protein [Halpernia frigidisoli]|uniref:Carboxypeptidase-like regulatory domain-containing protein n=1 Tax=Halpernia frigidisoli TaxID=1125876 RepID=A0A1I3GH60_9FLAO|nr:hypothetical protein [Halpernia frigidisoli]SFI22481.1 hypothetical protein SAMN05443292_1829 [Halpernia frigidisoli]
MKIILFSLLLLFPVFIFSQKAVSGIVSDENQIPLSGVLVVNINLDQKTQTNENGNFEINANSGDELRFVRQNYERSSVIIRSDSYFFGLKITMVYAPTDIEEVIVKPKLSGNLSKDSKSLNKEDKLAQLNKDIGLPKAPLKMREKPADVKKDVIAPLLSLSLKPQAIYDLISGKARRQKRLYQYDDFQDKLNWLKSNIKADFFLRNDIKTADISDFLNFSLLQSNDLQNCFKTKNTDKAEFTLLGLIPAYLKRRE